MNCDSVEKLIPLHYYGELPADDAAALDAHVAGCARCAAEMDRQRRMAAALDMRMLEPSADLLEECRADLAVAIRLAERQPNERRWTALFGSLSVAFAAMRRGSKLFNR